MDKALIRLAAWVEANQADLLIWAGIGAAWYVIQMAGLLVYILRGGNL